ncbi:MAG: 2-succinyl-6-hydroxy-2,4-cyclohexadiene-1-carboxylate synthase [Chloroflexi bacterium AL-W]|nr:2-succinyl-6-hydroxy-2,4-cyclohexadiene-1-carboxylate synthase [Chloroflexi bacterium AL-N1]NOK68230.1 2-succinyl-6-hydroxy-2,4-cyclohexadiene-1-carboxylate synthase [Chloroflexi bacterium AL-N10]NOK73876.1 2-succinyl-6-hydroxy-2,4-cyclohexadiene-1-carboxylate synthase [Chloroflexi bacterium AL-N5]NOK82844.1 2-succinyl-6-hydroxy-2,4-cyclohexadiene-1-carboxylate synthase [Chloroflexi bacterium AL-W]NOK90366.1 2-succinyl-6-hydroxy-2,4-cyclohexadiene-1-carboxylate synthase [Chloroflexi bacteriu
MQITINNNNFYVKQKGNGPTLLLLHGFTGSVATWLPFIPSFAEQSQVVAVDLLGHGQSATPAEPSRYRMECCVSDLLSLLDQLNLAQIDVLGYSMGGRVALQLAAVAPLRVRSLMLESTSPGLDSAAAREARIVADNALADQIESEGLAAFVEYWEQLPLFASQRLLPDDVRAKQRQQRLQNNPQGLANSLRGMGTGQQPSLWDKLDQMTTPTLLTVGALDTKFCGIASEMATHLPNVRVVTVPDAGHTIHLEQPATFIKTVQEFLQEFHKTKETLYLD